MYSDAEPTVGRAYSDLRYIREMLETSGTFTAVPGKGLVLMGAIGLLAARLDWLRGCGAGGEAWWQNCAPIWGAAFVAASAAGFWTMIGKARRLGLPLSRGPFVKAIRGLIPPLAVGGILTAAAVRAAAFGLVPGIWLAMYGTALLAGGQFSVRSVRAMGLIFTFLGAAALLSPAAQPHLWLGLGFGVIHLLFGGWIAIRHDG